MRASGVNSADSHAASERFRHPAASPPHAMREYSPSSAANFPACAAPVDSPGSAPGANYFRSNQAPVPVPALRR